MVNFKPDNTPHVPSKENFKLNFWDMLKQVIPNNEHILNEQLKVVQEKYSTITYDDMLKELGSIDSHLSDRYPNHIKGLDHTKNISPEFCLFMKALREDKSFAYAIIGFQEISVFSNAYPADFFSSAFHEGHIANNDFSASELLGNLYNSIALPAY